MYTILFAYVKQLQIIKSMFVGKKKDKTVTLLKIL